MKMKKTINIKCLALMLGLFAITASCTSDDLTEGDTKGDKQTDGTVFVGGKNSASASAKSRTAFDYLPSIGANSKFVWTVGDRIFLADGSVSEPLTGGYAEKFDVADFVFRGKNFTAPSYDIYYPGRNATAYNKLTIDTENNGVTWYDYAGTGKAYSYPTGDCGFAKAIRKPDGKYYFELEHLCAFLYLTPYCQTEELGKIITVTGCKIIADKNIAGEYTITPTGLKGTGSSNMVKTNITTQLSGTNYRVGVGYVNVDGSKKNRDYTSHLFHIAPADCKLKIEYNIRYRAFNCYDYSSARFVDDFDTTIIKNIPHYSYEKNTVTPMNLSIAFPFYKAIFTRWDAKKDYGIYADSVNARSSIVLKDVFKNNPDYQEDRTSLLGTKTTKDCPNRIEAAWYAMHGDPYYDENYVWTNGKYICRGGMWIKKKSEIPGFSSTNLPTDVVWGNDGCANSTIKKGRPADTSKYFFLPELGEFSDWSGGSLYIQFIYYGWYWTKDAKDNDFAWVLLFSKNWIRVQRAYRSSGCALWTVQ